VIRRIASRGEMMLMFDVVRSVNLNTLCRFGRCMFDVVRSVNLNALCRFGGRECIV
jgi:hypothetical protein